MSHNKRYKLTGVLVFFLGFALALSSSESQLEKELPFPISSFQLENGLQVILSENPSLPLVTVVMGYRAGPIYNQAGQSGLSYLLEGLMFSGSANVGRMQQYSFIQRIGGRLNAVTERGLTLFYQTVSSNHLATVLWMESDRMLSLSLATSDVEGAKNSLIEELSSLRLTNPYLESEELFARLIYPDFAYHSPMRGRSDDLRNITPEDVRNFYGVYYRPNNAVLCIVGDIDITKASELVDKYFRTIPKGPQLPVPPKPSPRTAGAKSGSIESSLARSPGFLLGYAAPTPQHSDFYPLKLAEYVLFKGNSSRLYNKLVKKERVASQLEGGIEVREDQAVFRIFVLNNNEFMKEKSRKDILSEINKLKAIRISEKELQKAKNRLKIDYVNQYATDANRAIFLAKSYLAGISLSELHLELEKYMSVTGDRLTWTVNKYLTENTVFVDIKIK